MLKDIKSVVLSFVLILVASFGGSVAYAEQQNKLFLEGEAPVTIDEAKAAIEEMILATDPSLLPETEAEVAPVVVQIVTESKDELALRLEAEAALAASKKAANLAEINAKTAAEKEAAKLQTEATLVAERKAEEKARLAAQKLAAEAAARLEAERQASVLARENAKAEAAALAKENAAVEAAALAAKQEAAQAKAAAKRSRAS